MAKRKARSLAGIGIAFLPKMVAEQWRHPGSRSLLIVNPKVELHLATTWRRGASFSCSKGLAHARARKAQWRLMALGKQVGGTSACFNTSLRLQPGAKLPTRNRLWLLEPLIQ